MTNLNSALSSSLRISKQCLFKYEMLLEVRQKGVVSFSSSNHWTKNWWQKRSGRVWMLKTNQGRDPTWFMSKLTSSLRDATQKAAVLQEAEFSASQHQAFCSMNPWKTGGGFPHLQLGQLQLAAVFKDLSLPTQVAVRGWAGLRLSWRKRTHVAWMLGGTESPLSDAVLLVDRRGMWCAFFPSQLSLGCWELY